MRVPFGLPSSLMRTTAFVSNLTYDPSGRRVSLAVRTMTALDLSPDLMSDPGSAFLTLTKTRSPTPAWRRWKPPERVDPPYTLMMYAILAPELSATSHLDSCCSMARSAPHPPGRPGGRRLRFDSYSDTPRSTTRTRVHFFVLLIGRHGATSTRSPRRDSLFSSCTCSTVRALTYLPYFGCFCL